MNQPRPTLRWLLAAGLAATPLACDLHDDDFSSLDQEFGDSAAIEDLCPALPEGVEMIPGLATQTAHDRFGGLVITLSTRTLACEEPALQNGQRGSGLGLTLGLPENMVVLGPQPFADASGIFVEWEASQSAGAGGHGGFDQGVVELLSISETCVTGRVSGLADDGGPFDGGFRAPRCAR